MVPHSSHPIVAIRHTRGSISSRWYDEWEHRFQCWFMATPMRAGLSACFGALSLHLAQRFEAFTHGLSKGAAPHGAKSNAHAEAGCEWVSEEAGKLQLPEFPTLGDGMTFTLPPIPRLLPSWEHLQTLAPAEHQLATGERAFGEGAREYVQGSIAEAAVGGAAGLVLGMLLTFGVAYGVRKRARGMRMQVRRGSASRHKAATGAAQQQATVASADAFSA